MSPKQRANWFRLKVKTHIRDRNLTSDARFLWLLLESYANMDGTSCHPSVETLMKVSDWCKQKVEKHLRELTKRGLIVVGKMKVKNGWVNSYTIRYPLTSEVLSVGGLGENITQGVGLENHPLPGIKGPEPQSPAISEDAKVIPFPPAQATG